jgi:hypothetical protein
MRPRRSPRRGRRARSRRVSAGHLERARGLLGALILDPPMIRVMAGLRPPSWFLDAGCLAVMRALFCVQRWPGLGVEEVISALQRHGDLDRAGGPDAVRALVKPGPTLEAGRRELASARASMPSVAIDPLVVFSMDLLAAELDASVVPPESDRSTADDEPGLGT